MKIRIEFTNTDRKNFISLMKNLELEDNLAENIESFAYTYHKKVLKGVRAEYSVEENFIEIYICQLFMNQIMDLIRFIGKKFKCIKLIVETYLLGFKDHFKNVSEKYADALMEHDISTDVEDK